MDRSVVRVSDPAFKGDTLVGRLSRWNGGGHAKIPLVEIQRLEVSKPSPKRTVLAVLAGALVAGIIYENTRPECKDCITLF